MPITLITASSRAATHMNLTERAQITMTDSGKEITAPPTSPAAGGSIARARSTVAEKMYAFAALLVCPSTMPAKFWAKSKGCDEGLRAAGDSMTFGSRKTTFAAAALIACLLGVAIVKAQAPTEKPPISTRSSRTSR